MTANPSTTSVAKDTVNGRYLEDLFLHARGCSRRVTLAGAAVEAAQAGTRVRLSDARVAYENTVSDLLAAIAPAAVERLHLLAAIAPGYYAADDDSYPASDLEPDVADELVRPLFEAAGILDDFISSGERFPNYEVDAPAEAEAEA